MDIKGVIYAFSKGLYDSFKGTFTLFYLDKELNERMLSRLSPTKTISSSRRKQSDSKEDTPTRSLKKHEQSKVLNRTLLSCVLNGVIFVSSILLFEYAFMPGLSSVLSSIFGNESFIGKLILSWLKPLLSIVFKVVWVLPLFLLSKIVNSLWFQDIADSAYRYSRGRPQFIQSISKLFADSVFSIVVQALFLVQAMMVNLIPIFMIGYFLSLIHMCLLYSLYAFEYKWYNMGWELHKRLTYIEENWPYFIGFGLPLAIFTQMPDSWVVSGGVFSVLFPFFIISGNQANPVTGVCNNCPLHLFSPVITLSNAMLKTTIRSNNKPGIKPRQHR